MAMNPLSYSSYEEYLDSQITSQDLFYLNDEAVARQLVELGFRGSGETLSREEFESRKKAEERTRLDKLRHPTKKLCSAGKDLSDSPFLKALSEREPLIRQGKLSTIVFIRDRNVRAQEVSGYIDIGYRMQSEDFEQYFNKRKKLLPNANDLSYYNWETHTCTTNDTPFIQVLEDTALSNGGGLLFKNKRDRKTVNVDPAADPGDNSRRLELATDEYIQVVFFDHVTRRKA